MSGSMPTGGTFRGSQASQPAHMSNPTMLCENCQKRVANVHLSGWKKVGDVSSERERVEQIDHHFCEDCATELQISSPLLNPSLRAGADARRLKLRVISVSPDNTVLRRISSEPKTREEDWIFLTTRLPSQYAVRSEEHTSEL